MYIIIYLYICISTNNLNKRAMEKMTFGEMASKFREHNEKFNVTTNFSDDNRLVGVIVFKSENWPDKNFSLESRSYRVVSDNKYFIRGMGGNSLFGNSIDGSDEGVRLDWYFGEWKIDYCYIEN